MTPTSDAPFFADPADFAQLDAVWPDCGIADHDTPRQRLLFWHDDRPTRVIAATLDEGLDHTRAAGWRVLDRRIERPGPGPAYVWVKLQIARADPSFASTSAALAAGRWGPN